MNTETRRHPRHPARTRAPSATTTAPALPLALRFPPACGFNAGPVDPLDSLARDSRSLSPLMLMDGNELAAHLSGFRAEARSDLLDTLNDARHMARELAARLWHLNARALALVEFMEAAGPPDEDNFVRPPLHERVLSAWGPSPLLIFDADDDTDPFHHAEGPSSLAGRFQPYAPRPGGEFQPLPVKHWNEGQGWAVPLGPDPANPDRWGFVPAARAAGAPELSAVVGG